MKIFSIFKGLCRPNPHCSLPILYSLVFPLFRPKIKKIRKNLHFLEFSQYFFKVLLILMHFLKNSPNLRALPNNIISFRPSKIGPLNIRWTPSTEKSRVNYCKRNTILLEVIGKPNRFSWKLINYPYRNEKFSRRLKQSNSVHPSSRNRFWWRKYNKFLIYLEWNLLI